jgi:hypothetical protein
MTSRRRLPTYFALRRPKRSARELSAVHHILNKYGVGILNASFACSLCGSVLTMRNKGPRAEYQCSRFIKRGKHACPGIGGRKKQLVEQALTRVIRPAIDGRVKKQALGPGAREALRARQRALGARCYRDCPPRGRARGHLPRPSDRERRKARSATRRGQVQRPDQAPATVPPRAAGRVSDLLPGRAGASLSRSSVASKSWHEPWTRAESQHGRPSRRSSKGGGSG